MKRVSSKDAISLPRPKRTRTLDDAIIDKNVTKHHNESNQDLMDTFKQKLFKIKYAVKKLQKAWRNVRRRRAAVCIQRAWRRIEAVYWCLERLQYRYARFRADTHVHLQEPNHVVHTFKGVQLCQGFLCSAQFRDPLSGRQLHEHEVDRIAACLGGEGAIILKLTFEFKDKLTTFAQERQSLRDFLCNEAGAAFERLCDCVDKVDFNTVDDDVCEYEEAMMNVNRQQADPHLLAAMHYKMLEQRKYLHDSVIFDDLRCVVERMTQRYPKQNKPISRCLLADWIRSREC